jgi:hypothetical protein
MRDAGSSVVSCATVTSHSAAAFGRGLSMRHNTLWILIWNSTRAA